jgi:hypothetical protein
MASLDSRRRNVKNTGANSSRNEQIECCDAGHVYCFLKENQYPFAVASSARLNPGAAAPEHLAGKVSAALISRSRRDPQCHF